ncbi:MAG: BglII/BstYI family type II restriction endonuclease [Chloroflexota bacterium]|nr:BglII/BstYI family type II restriction endonuclease [Chloroflexota bacterium]
MRIAGVYSFKGGQEVIEAKFAAELEEIKEVIAEVDGTKHKTKVSKEKTMPGRMLYKLGSMNKAFKREFSKRGWQNYKVPCEYPTKFYTSDYDAPETARGAFREIDFVKNRVGVEVQFGKYAFMVYNVCAKMTIFHNQDIIDVGVEVVPLKELANEMSTGVSYFEQFVWDLEHRGVADIDIPVLILGITI